MVRACGRKEGELRSLRFFAPASLHAEGSCLIEWGQTHVLCTASVEERVPPFLKGAGTGWVTAEYGMLPRATHTRSDREAAKGKVSGRTQEIQRLIGRALRSVTDLKALGERQVKIDCDVLQADGGTRCAAITGAYVALHLALAKLKDQRRIQTLPVMAQVCALSCGVVEDKVLLDLDYQEDSRAEADGNFVLTQDGRLIEVQVTGESRPLRQEEFQKLLETALEARAQVFAKQMEAILNARPIPEGSPWAALLTKKTP